MQCLITGLYANLLFVDCRMIVEEEEIPFRSDLFLVAIVENYSCQIVEMFGLRNESNFNEVRGSLSSSFSKLKLEGVGKIVANKDRKKNYIFFRFTQLQGL